MKDSALNIAIIVYSHYSRDARVRRYSELLARKDFQVDVICLKEDYHPKQTNISLIMYPFSRKRLGKFWYLIEYFFFFLYTAIILTIKTAVKRYKIVHVNNMPDILIFATLLPKMLGTKIILDMHDPMPELYMSKYHRGENSFLVKWLKKLEGLSFQFANHILTANETFKLIFLTRNNINKNKIDVILNCPDPKIFKPQANPRLPSKQVTHNAKQFILFYMGTVEERFGLDIVLEALPMMTRRIPKLLFCIIPKLEDEGAYFQELKQKIVNSNLSDFVILEQPLALEKIAQKLSQADAGVVLAKNGIFTQIILPVKLLEFVQSGIPVIATKTKILSQYFTNKQIYFLSKNTPEEFAQAVIDLYRNKKLRASLAQKAKKYFQKNNWPNEEKKYLRIINSLTA